MDKFIYEIIIKAGETLLSLSDKTKILYTKDTITDEVTQADLASEKVIIDAIKSRYPDHGIISEEADDHNIDKEYVWCIDPLDGTRNFATRVPLFGINIALFHNKILRYAAIYLPVTKELFYAEKDRGAFLNDKKMTCSMSTDWARAYGLVAPDCGPEFLAFLEKFNTISKKTGWMNSISSPAVSGAWVADGRRDFYIGPSKTSWDYAAPALLAHEAGCVVSNFKGEEWKPGDTGLILSTPDFFPELLKIVKTSFN